MQHVDKNKTTCTWSIQSGASTLYKRWSKCTMEKVGGSVFCRNLGGECINLMHLFVATRGEILSLKFTKYRLAAGLCPDPLGEGFKALLQTP